RGRVLLAQDGIRERHVDLPRPDALERRPVVIDPENADAGRGEGPQVRVRLRLPPRDVRDPELGVASGARGECPQDVVDLAVAREARRHLGALVVAGDGDRGDRAVEAVGAVADDVHELRHADAADYGRSAREREASVPGTPRSYTTRSPSTRANGVRRCA